MPRLVLCADDFGLSDGTSKTIARLAGMGRINATSCMSVLPTWPSHAPWLRGFRQLEVGLHIVLTDVMPLTAMPLLAPDRKLPSCDVLQRKAMLRRLPLDEIRAEIEAQFRRFIEVWGAPPQFVDGHQHVHLLPGIRAIVINATRRQAPGAWVRNCGDRLGAILARPFALKGLGHAIKSRGMAHAARSAGLACNDSFAGLYDFRADAAVLLPCYLAHPGQFHLVICHPGAADLPGDTIANARLSEADALERLPVADLAVQAGLDWP